MNKVKLFQEKGIGALQNEIDVWQKSIHAQIISVSAPSYRADWQQIAISVLYIDNPILPEPLNE